MKKIFIFILFCAVINLYGQGTVKKVHVSEFGEKEIKIENGDKHFYYDSKNISYERALFLLKEIELKESMSVSVFGLPNETDKYIFLVRTHLKKTAQYVFVDLSNNKLKYLFQDKVNVYDGWLRSYTIFFNKNEMLISLNHGDEGYSKPMVYLLSNNQIVKMPDINICYVCSNLDCNDDFFKKASVEYLKSAYYISIYNDLGTCDKKTEELKLNEKKKFVFKLTPQKFERVPELEK